MVPELVICKAKACQSQPRSKTSVPHPEFQEQQVPDVQQHWHCSLQQSTSTPACECNKPLLSNSRHSCYMQHAADRWWPCPRTVSRSRQGDMAAGSLKMRCNMYASKAADHSRGMQSDVTAAQHHCNSSTGKIGYSSQTITGRNQQLLWSTIYCVVALGLPQVETS